MKLRMVAEKVYGDIPGVDTGEGCLKIQMVMEDRGQDIRVLTFY